MWRQKEEFSRKKPYLLKRAQLSSALRAWFAGQAFVEVETPALQYAPGMETHLRALETAVHDPVSGQTRTLYLQTSPEFAMKKLLAAGMDAPIYQMCRCYRNHESGRLHSPEFTMLEWYRPHAGYMAIAEDCTNLLRHCAQALSLKHYRHGSALCDPFAPWEKITVCAAFERYAEMNLETLLDDRDAFLRAVRARGLHASDTDSWDDLFFRVFLAHIEPNLGLDRPLILYDYPACMAALARLKPGDPRFAERFELYVCGIELANAFGELTDPDEQARRCTQALAEKEALYGEIWPVDTDFIDALRAGLPPSGGIALGVDRLAMLAAGTGSIDDVLWCGKP